jgi:hypothetical protein
MKTQTAYTLTHDSARGLTCSTAQHDKAHGDCVMARKTPCGWQLAKQVSCAASQGRAAVGKSASLLQVSCLENAYTTGSSRLSAGEEMLMGCTPWLGLRLLGPYRTVAHARMVAQTNLARCTLSNLDVWSIRTDSPSISFAVASTDEKYDMPAGLVRISSNPGFVRVRRRSAATANNSNASNAAVGLFGSDGTSGTTVEIA